MHHKIPFFVAAPLTSIDLSLSSGEEIVIEERSPKELLNSRGGLGEQVAASGIAVWNPAFDVTPAHLICGIITEKVILFTSFLFRTVESFQLHLTCIIFSGSHHEGRFRFFQHKGVCSKDGRAFRIERWPSTNDEQFYYRYTRNKNECMIYLSSNLRQTTEVSYR